MKRFMFVIVPLALFVVGLIVVLNSVNWGSASANNFLRSQGGGMDTAQFMIVLQEYIRIYRWVGSILSVIGGLGVLKGLEVR